MIKRVQTNDNDMPYVNAEYTNRETLICDQKLPQQLDYTNLPAVGERSPSSQKQNKKKIPENLVLTNQTLDTEVEPSPALSTCSGPYIPISECFSGSPRYLGAPKTPLNNLDPPTNRSYNNIGFNLTASDQSYSPKITNFSSFGSANDSRSRSGRYSPTDSESVFTDDEMTTANPGVPNIPKERHPRPSDSSIENEAIVFTCSQRFSKLPGESGAPSDNYENVGGLGVAGNIGGFMEPRLRRDRKERLVLENISDTENTSPSNATKVSFFFLIGNVCLYTLSVLHRFRLELEF